MATTAKVKVPSKEAREKIAKVQALRKKIAARNVERQSEDKQKYAKMRLVAAKAPEKLEKCLAQLADKCASMAEGWENLRENLGLIKAPRQATLKVRVAAARNYAKPFQRIAEEAPDKLAEALAEAYQGLNDIASGIEMAAQQMGVDLETSPIMEDNGFGSGLEEAATQEVIEEADADNESPQQEHIEEHEEELAEGDEYKEASGSDPWVTDRDTMGPDTPVMANSGADGFVTDRDKSGTPEKPGKLDIPRAQGTTASRRR